jgi:hypothetical protein
LIWPTSLAWDAAANAATARMTTQRIVNLPPGPLMRDSIMRYP